MYQFLFIVRKMFDYNINIANLKQKMSNFKPSMASDSQYDQSGGTKLRVMHPSDSVAFFDYMNATGAIQVELANFGRFQTGTSIQGRLYYPFYNEDACYPIEDIDHWNDEEW